MAPTAVLQKLRMRGNSGHTSKTKKKTGAGVRKEVPGLSPISTLKALSN